MFLSAIIPSIGRQSLDKTIRSILSQKTNGFDFEIIVANDSKSPLVEREWLADERVRVINTYGKGRSVARNTAAGVSQGEYLYFIDDDDWMLPGGFIALHELSDQYPDAVVLYGGVQFSHEDGRIIGIMNMGLSGNRTSEILSYSAIPIGGAAISTAHFIRAGGFNQQFHDYEDVDLFRKLSTMGDFACTQSVIAAVLRGSGWNTSSEYSLNFENFRVSREDMLNSRAIFSRLNASATTPYAKGRNVRAYIASTVWNLKNKRFTTLFSRLLHGSLGTILAGTSLFHPAFWQALRDTQPPESDVKVMGLE